MPELPPLDEALVPAAGIAAATVVPEPQDKSFLEKRLAAALAAALTAEFDRLTVLTNKKVPGLVVPGWDPQPGAFDLVLLDHEQQPLLLVELKLDDVDQTLWDIFKLANALDLPTVRAAYVVAAAPPTTWKSGLACVELFDETGSLEWHSEVLLESHAKAWNKLLGGGTARPTRVPRILSVMPLLRVPVANYPPYELRVARIEKSGDWLPLSLGWPMRPRRGVIPDEELTLADLPAEDSGEGAIH